MSLGEQLPGLRIEQLSFLMVLKREDPTILQNRCFDIFCTMTHCG